jgi:hypothetical protein
MTFQIPLAPEHHQPRLAIDTATDLPASSKASKGGARTATGGCNPSIDACAEAMGGEDPDTAYAAAMLWYQGYPDPSHRGV